MSKIITQKQLIKNFHYNPETGIFKHTTDTRRKKAGQPFGHKTTHGYMEGAINNKKYYLHRLAFVYMTGEIPKQEVDHKDRVKHNNKWDNLSLVSSYENSLNAPIRKNNTSGHPGVWWSKAAKKWQATIKTNGVATYLGIFIDKEDAIKARQCAENKKGVVYV